MNEYHLSIMLLDYAVHLSGGQCPIPWDGGAIQEIAEARLLKQVFGGAALEKALSYYQFVNNMTVVRPSYRESYTAAGCMLREGLIKYCSTQTTLA